MGLQILSKHDWYNAEAALESNMSIDHVGVGFNIAVRVDSEEGEIFWMMLITTGEHVNTDAFMDDFDNDFVPSELLNQGYWYEQYQLKSRIYLLQDDRPFTYVHSHAILFLDFRMPPSAHFVKGNFASYELQVPILDSIIVSLLDVEAFRPSIFTFIDTTSKYAFK